MNKRRRYKAKRRRVERNEHHTVQGLRFHRDAFAMVWPMPKRFTCDEIPKFDVLYGVGSFRDTPRNV